MDTAEVVLLEQKKAESETDSAEGRGLNQKTALHDNGNPG